MKAAQALTEAPAKAPCPYCECSYCKARNVYMGFGQDGDSYCEQHKRKAPGRVILIDFPCQWCGK